MNLMFSLMHKTRVTVLLVSFVIASLPSVVLAKVGSRTVEAIGYGQTVQKAIDRALISGITQVNGAAMASRARSSMSSNTVSDGGTSSSQTAKYFQETIEKRTKGVVKSFEILSQQKSSSGLYNIKLSIVIATYEQSAQLKRLRIAVLPLSIDAAADNPQTAQRAGMQFSRGLENYLTQTRRFAVLDRSFLEDQNKELNFLKSDGVATEELARLGNRVGTDFIVVGALEEASSRVESTKMVSTGQIIKTPKIKMRVAYRVLDVASTQIKFASTSKGMRESGSLDTLADVLSSEAGQKILNAIMPIYVLGISGDKLTVGQGGDTLKEGANFSLMRLGEEIRDPYTGESLGQMESKVGTVAVESVQAKTAIVKIVKLGIPQDQLFSSDFIIRPMKSKKTPIAQKKLSDLEDQIDKEFNDDEKDKDKW